MGLLFIILYRRLMELMLLSTEQQIKKVLPKMIEKATDTQLKQAFHAHLQETEVQVLRVEQILREATGEAESTVCNMIVRAKVTIRMSRPHPTGG